MLQICYYAKCLAKAKLENIHTEDDKLKESKNYYSLFKYKR